jgi:hypothetical protein
MRVRSPPPAPNPEVFGGFFRRSKILFGLCGFEPLGEWTLKPLISGHFEKTRPEPFVIPACGT